MRMPGVRGACGGRSDPAHRRAAASVVEGIGEGEWIAGVVLPSPRPALVRRSPPSGEGGCGERSKFARSGNFGWGESPRVRLAKRPLTEQPPTALAGAHLRASDQPRVRLEVDHERI